VQREVGPVEDSDVKGFAATAGGCVATDVVWTLFATSFLPEREGACRGRGRTPPPPPLPAPLGLCRGATEVAEGSVAAEE